MPRIPIPDFIPSSQKEEVSPVERDRLSTEQDSIGKPSTPEEAALEKIERDRQETDQKSTPKDELSNTVAPPPNTLPPPLLTLLQTIQSTLSTSFPTSPPHTVQRLAELLLHPKAHYRTLPSYLRALDRIVSVASPASIFPLPDLAVGGPPSTGLGLVNGTSPSPTADDSASDRDFIGGAELTAIPWLRNGVSTPPTSLSHTNTPPTSDLRTQSTAVIDGPNGAGSIETVVVNVNGVSSSHPPREEATTNGITQGELLRQEQEAGIVPVPSAIHVNGNSRITRSNSAAATAAATRAVGLEPSNEARGGMDLAEEGGEAEVEPVHARGPGVIGMEDMGPQAPGSGLEGGLDLEGALGRRGEGMNSGAAAAAATAAERDVDGDGDVVIADADGVAEDEEGEQKGINGVNGAHL